MTDTQLDSQYSPGDETANPPSTSVTANRLPRWLTVALLFLSDLSAIALAAVSAVTIVLTLTDGPPAGLLAFIGLLAVIPLAFHLMGLYPAAVVGPVEEMQRILVCLSVFTGGTGLVLLLTYPDALPIVMALGTFWILAMLLIPSSRGVVRHLFAHKPWWGKAALVLGAGKTANLLISRINDNPGLDIKVIGCLDDDGRKLGSVVGGIRVAGPISDAVRYRQELGVAYVFIAMPGIQPDRTSQLVQWLSTLFQHVIVIPNALGMTSVGTSTRDSAGMVGIHVRGHLSQPRNLRLKRITDLLLLVPFVILAAPLLLISALAVVIVSPGNPFYGQVREGYLGKPIRIWKLRTMRRDADEVLEAYLAANPQARIEWNSHFKLQKDPRVIPLVGHFLRRSSLDELPQIFNIMRGELSFVGPRPFPYYHLAHYSQDFRTLRASVVPGLTGYWQVTSRSTADLIDQVELDSYYIKNWSLWLDLYIIARTPIAIIMGSGAY